VNIRPARSADWEYCADLDHSSTTDYAWRMEEREQNGSISITFEPVRLPRQARVPYPRQGGNLAAAWTGCDLFLVAEVKGQIQGYATVRGLSGHGLAWVQDLVVHRSFRRQGIGSEMLEKVAAWAREEDLHRLVVETHTRNYPGICFCRSQGLSFCGFDDQHWRTNDIAVLFGRRLR
jgi:GNAT superfamily N-acetyltransferase